VNKKKTKKNQRKSEGLNIEGRKGTRNWKKNRERRNRERVRVSI